MLFPINKYLVVEPIEQDAEASKTTVLIPDGVEVKRSRFSLVRLVEASVDSNLRPGMSLLVHDHMLEKAEVNGKTYYLLVESQVVGFLGKDES